MDRKLRLSPAGQRRNRSRGQVLVIFAASLLALLFFVGLALDAGVAYVSYGQLKRAVDAAAVAAANSFKTDASYDQIVASVVESLKLQNVDTARENLQLNVQVCDKDEDGRRDDDRIAAEAPEFLELCPETDPEDLDSASARKLVWIRAYQRTPFYFLSLLGFRDITLSTTSTAEAAAIDLVLVIDVSESMAAECETPAGATPGNCLVFKTPGYGPTTWNDYDPVLCNAMDDQYASNYTNPDRKVSDIEQLSRCYPLRGAINAAIGDPTAAPGSVDARGLIDSLYEGYDRISLITFDSKAHVRFSLRTLYGDNRSATEYDIAMTQLHDDAPYARVWPYWRAVYGTWNLTNPEDRDGDGEDTDPGKPCWINTDGSSRTPTQWEYDNRWDGALGVPCDDPDRWDAFDWDKDGIYTEADHEAGRDWLYSRAESVPNLLSTCTGCGIRAAADELRRNGRPGAVWVIIILSDGAVNLSDTPTTAGKDGAGRDIIPAAFPYGFCTSQFWSADCRDPSFTPRYCIDDTAATCPPGSTWDSANPGTSQYSPYDYALDMTDAAALQVVRSANAAAASYYNANEPIGDDIAIYSIGLGPSVSTGETLLRYMAAVGDDGDRYTDLCQGVASKRSCGQYYFAETGEDLRAVFDNIASRIYTKITR